MASTGDTHFATASDAQCPVPRAMVSDYNPLVTPHRDDPFPYYREARHRQPVSYVPALDAWMVTRYDDILAVLHDPVRFSSRRSVPWTDGPGPEILEVLAGGVAHGRLVITEDPPEHTTLRTITDRALQGRRSDALRPRIRARVDALIDDFADEGRADLVSQLSEPLANRVMCAVLGIPAADATRVRAWSDALLVLSDPYASTERKRAAAHRFVDYQRYIVDLIAARRRDPRDDMISDLVTLDDLPGTPVPLEDAVRFVWGNHLAGLHTTSHAIGSAMLAMLSDRRHWEHACAEPGSITAMFEEALRRDAPHRGLFRHTTEPVGLGGVALPKGAAVLLLFGAANRDETRFDAPDEFRPDRSDLRAHLGFGDGIHACAGAHLARTEGHIALSALAERLPGLRLARDFVAAYQPQLVFRGLQRLDVVWDA